MGYMAFVIALLINGFYPSTEAAAQGILAALAAAAASAWIFPLFKSFGTGNENIFKAPFEVAAGIGWVVLLFSQFGDLPWLLHAYYIDGISTCILFGCVAVSYWVSGCLRQAYVMGCLLYTSPSPRDI